MGDKIVFFDIYLFQCPSCNQIESAAFGIHRESSYKLGDSTVTMLACKKCGAEVEVRATYKKRGKADV